MCCTHCTITIMCSCSSTELLLHIIEHLPIMKRKRPICNPKYPDSQGHNQRHATGDTMIEKCKGATLEKRRYDRNKGNEVFRVLSSMSGGCVPWMISHQLQDKYHLYCIAIESIELNSNNSNVVWHIMLRNKTSNHFENSELQRCTSFDMALWTVSLAGLFAMTLAKIRHSG